MSATYVDHQYVLCCLISIGGTRTNPASIKLPNGRASTLKFGDLEDQLAADMASFDHLLGEGCVLQWKVETQDGLLLFRHNTFRGTNQNAHKGGVRLWQPGGKRPEATIFRAN